MGIKLKLNIFNNSNLQILPFKHSTKLSIYSNLSLQCCLTETSGDGGEVLNSIAVIIVQIVTSWSCPPSCRPYVNIWLKQYRNINLYRYGGCYRYQYALPFFGIVKSHQTYIGIIMNLNPIR